MIARMALLLLLLLKVSQRGMLIWPSLYDGAFSGWWFLLMVARLLCCCLRFKFRGRGIVTKIAQWCNLCLGAWWFHLFAADVALLLPLFLSSGEELGSWGKTIC
jgi:hypothetical protein